MPIGKRIGAEFLGTFMLVLAGCGAAVLGQATPSLGIGGGTVAIAFGLALLAMIYALGPISGGHFNPAVTVGMLVGKRFPSKDVMPYILAQVTGGLVGAAVLFLIAHGRGGFSAEDGFASNGFGARSPGGYSMFAAFVVEMVLTFGLVFVILGTSHRRSMIGFAPLCAGFSMMFTYFAAMPVTGAGMNPARSTATAMFAGGAAIAQLWLFWVAPILGGALAGVVYPLLVTPPASGVATEE